LPVGGISLIAVGVDVSVKRRLDVVVLDESGRIVEAPRERQSAEDLEAALSRLHPAVVAIDSPPAFGVDGRSRLAERRLMQVGINIYATPSDPAARSRPFYRWILAGMEAYEAAERAGFFLYRGPGPVTGRAIEVFPHASAVCLRGKLPPLRLRRKSQRAQWRKAALASRGVAVETLHSLDQVDAALAALTGLRNGQLLAVPGLRAALEGLCSEAASVARAEGFEIADREAIDLTVRIARRTRENRASMLQDVQLRRRTEVDAITGAVLRAAKRHDLRVPMNLVSHALVMGLERSYRGPSG